ncbi:MAG: thioredoxin family protein [Kiritimatiellae bacterium]|nr:thioredoxin family protein [Kiritimatiellia bacterium]
MMRITPWMIGLALSAGTAPAADRLWTDDYEQAVNRAQVEGKALLLNFTGSDWCGWCIRLHKEVFAQEVFKTYAESNLVCVTIDFPSERVKLSTSTRKQNQRLQEKYQIRGYPSILLLSPKEKVLAQTGYKAGGAEAYVEHLKQLLEPHIDQLIPTPSRETVSEVAPDATSPRTWTSTTGTTLDATYRQRVGDLVHLQRANGTTVKIGFGSLSAADQDYLRSIKAFQ